MFHQCEAGAEVSGGQPGIEVKTGQEARRTGAGQRARGPRRGRSSSIRQQPGLEGIQSPS